jgi:metal-responsive CopG/Arc/MetJ family transcriptional regulator
MAEPLDQRIQLVISKGQLREIDEWRRLQPDLPSRSEAIRRLIEAGLKSLANNRSSSGKSGREPG